MARIVTLNLGKGIVQVVDKDKLNAEVKDHGLDIGLKNILQDSHAAFTKKAFPETYKVLSKKAVDRKFAAMLNGEMRVNRPSMNVEDIKAAMSLEELKAEIVKREKEEKAKKSA